MGFAQDIKKFVNKTKAKESRVVRKTLFLLNANVAKRTPVDTGVAREGWIASLNSPASGTTGGGIGKNNSVASGAVGEIYYLTNNVKYIRILEFGGYKGVGPKTQKGNGGIYSKQAPAGMVRISMKEVQAALRKFIREENRR